MLDEQKITIEIDPKQEQTTISLADYALGAGRHCIKIRDHTFKFAIVERFRESPSLPHLLLPIAEGKVSMIPINPIRMAKDTPDTAQLSLPYLSGSSFDSPLSAITAESTNSIR